MTFDESRDNLLDIEAASIEADAHAETREADDNRPMERRVADAWWATRNAEADAPDDVDHDADENHPMGGDDDAWHGHGDDDEPEEDDGQPSEYEEWQDYMGGDEYYDHSENGEW